MAEGLKPCPFCGRVDKLKIWAIETPFDDKRLTNWRVSCDRSGDNTGCGGSSGAYRTRKEAIEAWNRRANGMMLGKWVKSGECMTPGGTPIYVCGKCGGSAHLHGAEYPRRKMICDGCGRVNIYPWETSYDQTSSLWEEDKHDQG